MSVFAAYNALASMGEGEPSITSLSRKLKELYHEVFCTCAPDERDERDEPGPDDERANSLHPEVYYELD